MEVGSERPKRRIGTARYIPPRAMVIKNKRREARRVRCRRRHGK